MSDQFEHNPKDHEDPLPGPTWLIGIISVVLLLVIFLGLTGLYYGTEEEETLRKAAEIEPIYLEVEELRQTQLRHIEGEPGLQVTIVDGQVTDRRTLIPIELAMQKIVEEEGRP